MCGRCGFYHHWNQFPERQVLGKHGRHIRLIYSHTSPGGDCEGPASNHLTASRGWGCGGVWKGLADSFPLLPTPWKNGCTGKQTPLRADTVANLFLQLSRHQNNCSTYSHHPRTAKISNFQPFSKSTTCDKYENYLKESDTFL